MDKGGGQNQAGGRAPGAGGAFVALAAHPLLWCGVAAALFVWFGEIPRALRWPARFVIFAAGAWGLGRAVFLYRGAFGRLLGPFRTGGKTDWPLVAVSIVMHGILLSNAVLHYTLENYDQEPHRQNARIWAELRMPLAHETRGIHYAPLSYWPASLALRLGFEEKAALKAAQVCNVIYSAVLVFFLLKLAELARPGSLWIKRGALLALATLPVYYKTFAMPRPEPMLAMWSVIAVWLAARIFCGGSLERRTFLLFGVTVGLMVLTRQWGAFLFPAFGVLLLFALRARPQEAGRLAAGLVVAAGVSVLAAGWYYALLTAKYGSPAAFNSELMPFALSNKPAGFYLDWFPAAYFAHPVIYTLGDRLFPIMQADTWGDYWGYWRFERPPFRTGEHEVHEVVRAAVPYLSRVSYVSLVCSAFLAAGWLVSLTAGLRHFRKNGPVLAAGLSVLSTLACFFVFAVCYKNSSAIKASYILQIFPFLALGFGLMMDSLIRWNRAAGLGLLAVYLAAALHQAPLFFTNKVKLSEAEMFERFASPLLLVTLAAGAAHALWLCIGPKEKSCPAGGDVR